MDRIIDGSCIVFMPCLLLVRRALSTMKMDDRSFTDVRAMGSVNGRSKWTLNEAESQANVDAA